MITWLNGTFGVGKTTTARQLAAAVPNSRIFDPETIGFMLRPVLHSVPVRDFQDWKPWRHLVVETASQILDYVGGSLIVAQSVLVEQYWDEIQSGLHRAGIPVHHFVLHADPDTLTHRIHTDTIERGARQWRLDHLPDYQQALGWLSIRAHVIDTTPKTPDQVAQLIAEAIPRTPVSAANKHDTTDALVGGADRDARNCLAG